MGQVINMHQHQYMKEQAGMVYLMWQETEHMKGWVKVVSLDELAWSAAVLMDTTYEGGVSIKEAGRMTPDMSVEDLYETLGGLACEVGENPGWFKLNRESAEATIEHLIDMRLNPIHLEDFEPGA